MLMQPSTVTAATALARGQNPITTATKPTALVSAITVR
jgi:hypothetical protein